VLIWRLTIELHYGQGLAESAERLASRIGGALLFALAAYVVTSAAWKLWTGTGSEIFPARPNSNRGRHSHHRSAARSKLTVADRLGSHSLRADAAESITCGWLAFVVVATLVAQRVIGGWSVDPVASIAIVWLLIREGREA
jgi:divalent metal cation (Fe/Co/Zn/Cd) transporter